MFTRATQCVRGVLDPPVSAFSLSLYRHPFLYTLFISRFTLIINNNVAPTKHSKKVGTIQIEDHTIFPSLFAFFFFFLSFFSFFSRDRDFTVCQSPPGLIIKRTL
jgi:hypothetical protein